VGRLIGHAMNKATGPGKYLQKYEMYSSKENKHRDLGSKRVTHEFESPAKFNLSTGKVHHHHHPPYLSVPPILPSFSISISFPLEKLVWTILPPIRDMI